MGSRKIGSINLTGPLVVSTVEERRVHEMEMLKSGFGLLEAPIWDSDLGLLFADTDRGGILCLNKDLDVSTIVPHRRGIGGAVRHADGGIVVSGRNVAYKSPGKAETVVLMQNDSSRGIVGFNDITTDSRGRIYAGALGFVPTHTPMSGIGGNSRSAPLFLIDLDGSARPVFPDVKLTNGLGFSPDGSVLYHADSGDQRVYRFDVSPDGSLSNRRPFMSVTAGLPDGLAVSEDGAIWVAIAHGGRILRFSSDGVLEAQIEFPVPMITSLCFGGDDMRDVYVVSGSDGTGRSDAGSIFRLRSDVPGVKIARAQIPIPSGGNGT
jgi:D-xylonolactonase